MMESSFRRDAVLEPRGRFQFVRLEEAKRVGLERRHHARERLAQGSLRFPAQGRSSPANVKGVVIIGEIDHPGLDERLFARHMVLQPSSGFREGLRNGLRLPLLAVNESAEGTLQVVVAHGVWLTD